MTEGATSASLEPIRAAWRRYVAVFAGLGLLVVTILLTVWPWPHTWVIENVLLPQYEASFGFRGGMIPVADDSEITGYAIVHVVPGGRLARAGVRDGDIPYGGHHGGGSTQFWGAMKDASAGEGGDFQVMAGPHQWEQVRRIELHPERWAK